VGRSKMISSKEFLCMDQVPSRPLNFERSMHDLPSPSILELSIPKTKLVEA